MESTLDTFGSQDTSNVAGFAAGETLWLTVLMSAAGVAIFVVVMVFIALAWRGRGGGQTWWIVGGGVIFPVVVIGTLFVTSTFVLRAIAGPSTPAHVIEVTGKQFWWDVIYDPEGRALRDANEVVLPLGEPVEIRLKSTDVIHSFWVPSIAGKMDMIPGRVNTLTVTATREGRFRGQCAEFCGLAHPLMAFEAVVLPPEEYDAFLADLDGEARDAVTPQERRGAEVFQTSGCVACHRVQGISDARIGPDLTRVGGRAALGAGMWEMNTGNLAGWIADVGDMKPGAEMPSYNQLSGPDLRALVAWLESLT
ncbi:cytochrome c oxidase subunit II [Maritimibacter sp. UBA3975]|uniref:cytochrome c oxidase subunit II n=1 Tax=Maritimibacter sp. UBA3975 TaxID=1946833 RepID=UPI000C0A72D0|nr:cytochrome c oxidase subunit II [Maritimibacter sp. UBA3975]MAM62986.1 cytochrome c oxidase subunit II [Maritimibacter sp.]|tara:strand:+ start:14128 stop:15054 length:927 start_codon:yes stop_codon:yes gene_type:complete